MYTHRGGHTHSLTNLPLSHTESRAHSLSPPALTQSGGYTHSHLQTSTQSGEHTYSNSLRLSLSLSLSKWRNSLFLSLSLSLTHEYSHSPTYIQKRAHSLTIHSHTQKGEHTHSTSSQRFEGTLTPTLFHTKIGWHTHSHIHPLKTSHSHILTNRPLSRIEWRPRSLLPPRS